VLPDVLVNLEDPHPLQAGRVGDEDPASLGEDRVVDGIPRHAQGGGDPGDAEVTDYEAPSAQLALDPAITRQFLKLYVAFKAEMTFVSVVPQKARLRLALNIPIESLRDDRSLAWDVSGKGHWGNGTTEAPLSEDSDFTYVLGLVRQAYEYQMGGD